MALVKFRPHIGAYKVRLHGEMAQTQRIQHLVVPEVIGLQKGGMAFLDAAIVPRTILGMAATHLRCYARTVGHHASVKFCERDG